MGNYGGGGVPKEDFETQRQIRAKHQFPWRLASNEKRIFCAIIQMSRRTSEAIILTGKGYLLGCATNGFGFDGEKFL